jgi:hypothetical protein
MEAKLRRVGSSLGVILPKETLDAQGLAEGDLVDIPRLGTPFKGDFYGIWRRDPVVLDFDEA